MEITPERAARLEAAPSVDPTAYDLYLRASFLCEKWAPQEILEGLSTMRRAVAADPQLRSGPGQPVGRLPPRPDGPVVPLVPGVRDFTLSNTGTLVYNAAAPPDHEFVWADRNGTLTPAAPGWSVPGD